MKDAVATFIHSVKVLCPKVAEEELAYLRSSVTIRKLELKEFFIEAGIIQHEIGYVFSGLLRSFYVDHHGNEISVNFIREGLYATHYPGFLNQSSCKYFLQCLEPSVLVCLNYHSIQEGYERFPNLERYGRIVAEEVLKTQQKRIEGFLFDTPEKRYLDFIQAHPDLFNRVSLSHLSSYLGIERQTLTRIRQKLAKHSF